ASTTTRPDQATERTRVGLPTVRQGVPNGPGVGPGGPGGPGEGPVGSAPAGAPEGNATPDGNGGAAAPAAAAPVGGPVVFTTTTTIDPRATMPSTCVGGGPGVMGFLVDAPGDLARMCGQVQPDSSVSYTNYRLEPFEVRGVTIPASDDFNEPATTWVPPDGWPNNIPNQEMPKRAG